MNRSETRRRSSRHVLCGARLIGTLTLLTLLLILTVETVNQQQTRVAMASPSIARVYADVNQNMPRSYWDYDSVNISWGVLENYEVVRKIGAIRSQCFVDVVLTVGRSRQILRSL